MEKEIIINWGQDSSYIKKIKSEIEGVELSDRSYLILRGRWSDIIVVAHKYTCSSKRSRRPNKGSFN